MQSDRCAGFCNIVQIFSLTNSARKTINSIIKISILLCAAFFIFQDVLAEVCLTHKIKLGKVVASPILGLTDYILEKNLAS